jgi:hypothetical protein
MKGAANIAEDNFINVLFFINSLFKAKNII